MITYYLSLSYLACSTVAIEAENSVPKTPKAAQVDARKYIKRGFLRFTGSRAQYRLPYHKGDRFYRGTDVLLGQQDVADAVHLLRLYITRRDKLYGAKPDLFLREDGSPPTHAWWDKIFFALLNKDSGGHSVRAGAATFYANLGVSESLIQALGRWSRSSDAWRIYIRDNPSVRIELQLAHLRQR